MLGAEPAASTRHLGNAHRFGWASPLTLRWSPLGVPANGEGEREERDQHEEQHEECHGDDQTAQDVAPEGVGALRDAATLGKQEE
jgi:hypothetical protein